MDSNWIARASSRGAGCLALCYNAVTQFPNRSQKPPPRWHKVRKSLRKLEKAPIKSKRPANEKPTHSPPQTVSFVQGDHWPKNGVTGVSLLGATDDAEPNNVELPRVITFASMATKILDRSGQMQCLMKSRSAERLLQRSTHLEMLCPARCSLLGAMWEDWVGWTRWKWIEGAPIDGHHVCTCHPRSCWSFFYLSWRTPTVDLVSKRMNFWRHVRVLRLACSQVVSPILHNSYPPVM